MAHCAENSTNHPEAKIKVLYEGLLLFFVDMH